MISHVDSPRDMESLSLSCTNLTPTGNKLVFSLLEATDEAVEAVDETVVVTAAIFSVLDVGTGVMTVVVE